MDIKKELRQEIDRNRQLLAASKDDERVKAVWGRLVDSAELAAEGNDKELQQSWITRLQTYRG